jgi:hypothetical protein
VALDVGPTSPTTGVEGHLVATAAFAASGQQAWAAALLLVGIAFITTVSGWLAPRLSISAEEETVSAAA